MRSRSRRYARIRLISRIITALLIAAGMMVALALLESPQGRYAAQFSAQPAAAQQYGIPVPSRVADAIYEQMPEIPREDQYISQRTGAVDPENTLLSRIIQYHALTKGRLPTSRFDWKLTLADYMGLNEPIVPGAYPGALSLTTNPLEADMAIVSQFNQSQRETLVNTIVAYFDPDVLNPPPQLDLSNTPSASPQEQAPPPGRGSSQPLPLEPRPGDAQLLLP